MDISTFLVVILLSFVSWASDAATLNREQSFVITGSNSEGNILSRVKRDSPNSSIKSLRVNSVIVSRFARVTFVSEMENTENVAKEMVFSVRLPTAAFITDFDMVVGGVKFVGKVKEKEEAKEQYDRAVESGNSAGLVVADVRETQTFDVSANVPPESSVEFQLVYQQLLERKLGQYEHVILINPQQVIDDFGVDVYITESSGIISLSTINPGSQGSARGKADRGGNSGVVNINTEVRRSRTQAKISFMPTGVEKRRFLSLPEDEQKFTVKYDVERESIGGEIQMRNGYFVHFFAPEDLPVLPKRVIFVIDRSGSMDGRKIQQTKTAFVSMIKELRDSDKFNIISFAGDATAWKTETGLVPVTTTNVMAAIDYVREIRAIGGTNLNDAVLTAADLLSDASMEDAESSMIILLTDGMPTAGEDNTAQIRLNVKQKIDGRFSLFCLGFGEDLKHDFLKRLASENDGIARKIYEASDADLQLKGFFQEVATPLLLNVKMSYTGANLTELSNTDFGKFFKGSESIIVGSYEGEPGEIRSTITGESNDGEVIYSITGTEMNGTFQHWYKDTGEFDDFIERLWAYFTITNLLEKKTLSEDPLERQEITNRVLSLALRYNFVTPLTSLVVTLPENEIATTTVDPTIIPPLPPCYARGSSVPRHIRHPIWCPLILDPFRPRPGHGGGSSGSGSSGGGSSGGGSFGGRSSGRASSRSFNAPPPKRKPSPNSGRSSGAKSLLLGGLPFPFGAPAQPGQPQGQPGQPMQPGQPGQPSQPGQPGMPTSWPTIPGPWGLGVTLPTRPPAPKLWKGCSAKLQFPSRTMQLPNLPGPRDVFLCRYQIRLSRGKWIDLHVEMANTTRNSVTIKSKGNTIFEHKSGVSSPRSFYLDHNKLDVVFTVYKDDDARPGIVISYEEFQPDEEELEATQPSYSAPAINCGQNFSSSVALNGTITSPNYPKLYPENAHCVWNLRASESNYDLKLSFIDVDIEANLNGDCGNDKLIITEGDNEHIIICGYNMPNDIVTTETTTQITFMTDGELGAAGFKIRYEFIPI